MTTLGNTTTNQTKRISHAEIVANTLADGSAVLLDPVGYGAAVRGHHMALWIELGPRAANVLEGYGQR